MNLKKITQIFKIFGHTCLPAVTLLYEEMGEDNNGVCGCSGREEYLICLKNQLY
jgi:hypothetical protein